MSSDSSNTQKKSRERGAPALRRDTRKDIFFAAVELFSENGYNETSMRDIARKAGIKPASIYNHFPSKELIMDEMLDYYLERMEGFYEKMDESMHQVSRDHDLEELLQLLMFRYEPEELTLMFQLTRIVHHEQFRFEKAGDALMGSGYRRFVDAHEDFFDRLSDAGLIRGRARNKMYAEIFARVSLTFSMQFLHPEIEPTLPSQEYLYPTIISLIVDYERNQGEETGAGAAKQ